jgi:hypothetical protein
MTEAPVASGGQARDVSSLGALVGALSGLSRIG